MSLFSYLFPEQNKQLINIMSKISEFAANLKQHQDRVDQAVSGIKDDVANLKAKIEELQNTPGEITPEDQALLDAITASADALAGKLEALDGETAAAPTPPE